MTVGKVEEEAVVTLTTAESLSKRETALTNMDGESWEIFAIVCLWMTISKCLARAQVKESESLNKFCPIPIKHCL